MSDEEFPSEWLGAFPRNLAAAKFDANHPYNLAESTAEDLTLGEFVRLVGAEALEQLSLGYGPAAGRPDLREAIGRICDVPPESVLTTHGVAFGLFLLAFEICRPGDEAVLTVPCFPPSRNALTACGVKVRQVRQSFDEKYTLDLDAMAEQLNPRTRLVSLTNPANPSGVVLGNDILQRLLDLMAERAPNALLFVDESYREATYGNEPPPSAAVLGPRVIVGASVSKAYGAPGLRVGWLIITDRSLRERLTVAKTNTMISCSSMSEAMASLLVTRRDRTLHPRRRRMAEALGIVKSWIDRENERVEWVAPDAGGLCCVRLRHARFPEIAVKEFWSKLPSPDLQLSPGSWFGDEERIFRLGFGYLPTKRLVRALSILSQAMNRQSLR